MVFSITLPLHATDQDVNPDANANLPQPQSTVPLNEGNNSRSVQRNHGSLVMNILEEKPIVLALHATDQDVNPDANANLPQPQCTVPLNEGNNSRSVQRNHGSLVMNILKGKPIVLALHKDEQMNTPGEEPLVSSLQTEERMKRAQADYERGLECENCSDREAAVFFKKAADEGHAKAQYKYGYALAIGKGVPVDREGAVKYYKLAVDQNEANAQLCYGISLICGFGIDRNLKEALKYFKLSAAQNNPLAQNWCGKCFEEGLGTGVNFEEALKYFVLAANRGHVESQVKCGIYFREGQGAPTNLECSARFFKAAAEGKNAAAEERNAEDE
jgi:TPR repeat protein